MRGRLHRTCYGPLSVDNVGNLCPAAISAGGVIILRPGRHLPRYLIISKYIQTFVEHITIFSPSSRPLMRPLIFSPLLTIRVDVVRITANRRQILVGRIEFFTKRHLGESAGCRQGVGRATAGRRQGGWSDVHRPTTRLWIKKWKRPPLYKYSDAPPPRADANYHIVFARAVFLNNFYFIFKMNICFSLTLQRRDIVLLSELYMSSVVNEPNRLAGSFTAQKNTHTHTLVHYSI